MERFINSLCFINSPALSPFVLSDPCIPVQITTKYSLSIGQVVWDVPAGAKNYTVEGVTEQGSMASCVTNDTYCALYNLNCGQLYSISVTANNQVCQGVATSNENITITTGEETVVCTIDMCVNYIYFCLC